jgi:hypothetical protein
MKVMHKKKNPDNLEKLETESLHTESENKLMTRRGALTTIGKAAIGAAAFTVLASSAATATGALGKGVWASASAAQQTPARPSSLNSLSTFSPSIGIFAYVIPSTLNLDVSHETVTLPLYRGRTSSGKNTWYIVTESSDQADAMQRGVNYSNKLLNALGTKAVQNGHFENDTLVFDGTVNFGLKRVLVPDPVNGFPPLKFAPGAMGDAEYSPLVHYVRNGRDFVINASQVANQSGVSGSVVDIDYNNGTVTLLMLAGFVDGQFSGYLRTDASIPLVAAIERSTLAPNLNAAPGIANDEPPSSRAAIIPVVNGIRGDDQPMRQGLQSALLGQGDPFNVEQEQPSDPVHYSPIWDVTPVAWTNAAIAAGNRVQLQSQDDIRVEALAGNIVSALPGTPNAGLGGINAIGAISNCPVMFTFPGRDYVANPNPT